MPSTIGYLGPKGTFSHEALEKNLAGDFDQAVPLSTIKDVLLAVQQGKVERGIVPIENSIEGTVNVTVDTLAFDIEAPITGEVVHPVRHCLVAGSGTDVLDISEIISHPHAAAQCRLFLEKHFRRTPVVAANSTAEAAMSVSESSKPRAAIATKLAADLYGLDVLRKGIEDYPQNKSRFVVVGGPEPERTGSDKTSIVCFIRENRPGSLLEILQQFASRGINLTKLESRPTKEALGEYYFYIDLEGHRADRGVAEAIEELRGALRELKVLGSYPAAG